MSRANYFDLLDLDPDVAGPDQIKEAITRWQLQWSQLVNHPMRGTEARRKLEEVAELRRVLGDPTRRQREAEQARGLRLVREAQAQIELDALLEKTLRGDGMVSEEQLANLERQFAGRLRPAMVQERITLLNTPLESVIARQIDDLLRQTGHADLFEFLGERPDASAKRLREAARTMHANLHQVSGKHAEHLVRLQLVGHCLRLFGDVAHRVRYERHRREFLTRGKEEKPWVDPAKPEQMLVLSWRLRRTGLFRRRREALLECQGEASRLRRVCIRGRVNDLPRSSTEGELLGEWTGEGVSQMPLILPLRSWKVPFGEVFCRLFVEPADVVVYHPATEEVIL